MHSKLANPRDENAIAMLLSLNPALDEERAIALLTKNKWNLESAASELFSEPTPTVEFLPPSPSTQTGALAWNQAAVHDNVTSVPLPTDIHQGALNVPARIVPSQPKPQTHETIDLTGDDDDEDMRKALAASLALPHVGEPEPTSTALVVAGPLRFGDDTPLQPSDGAVRFGLSQEDQALNRALEASLSASLQADVYEEVPLESSVRSPEKPVALRTKHLGRIHAVLLLQALHSVPQVRQAFKSWHADSKSDPPPPLPDISSSTKIVHALQLLFAAMDLTQRSNLTIDQVLDDVFPNVQGSPADPGDDMKTLLDLRVASICDHAFMNYHRETHQTPEYLSRLFLSRTQGFNPDSGVLALITNDDHATLEIMSANSATEPNTLESALFQYLLRTPIPSYFTFCAPVISIRIRRLDTPTPLCARLVYPTRLFLDAFLLENKEFITLKLEQMEQCFEEAEVAAKAISFFSSQEDRDLLADLNRTISYVETEAAGLHDVHRANQLSLLATKLKTIQHDIEVKLKDCNEQIAGSRSQISTLMQVNELKNHPYDLRAVLVHDGMVGREHSYAYLRDHASGKWYRACDAEMIEVSENIVLDDTTGLHLNSGPYFLVYSQHIPEDQDFQTLWSEKLLNNIAQDNHEFMHDLHTRLQSQKEV